jgi:capsule polysaccharide export protein KpsC/LpsZ
MAVGPAQGIACLAGIAPWKRKRVRQLLGDPSLPTARNAKHAIQLAKSCNGAVACWASRIPNGLLTLAESAGIEIWLIEDGFIRSRGLGAALHLPSSIVVDRSGIYYDPAQPSDLEKLLQANDFDAAELQRSTALIAQLRESGVTKYNLAGATPELPQHRRIILVIGQVDDDRSVLLGGAGLDSAGLLTRVREIEPDTYIVYKPHPDVVAGLRNGAVNGCADLIAPDANLLALIERADAVHVLSSLAGFEALLRGGAVHVHGQPFYAGWGLTLDYAPVPRRTARPDLAALAAGVLISYPLYCDPDSGSRIEVEQLVQILAERASGRRETYWRRTLGVAALAFRNLFG